MTTAVKPRLHKNVQLQSVFKRSRNGCSWLPSTNIV